ncbi:MAG: tetratricopeptide repeat protein [Candidatus Comchoanobacterales bacterium]
MRYSIALILMLLWGSGNAGDHNSGIDLVEGSTKPTSSGHLEDTNDIDLTSLLKAEEIEALHQEARDDETGEKAFLLGRQYFFNFDEDTEEYLIRALEWNTDSVNKDYDLAREYEDLYVIKSYYRGNDRSGETKDRMIKIYSNYFKNDNNIKLIFEDPTEWIKLVVEQDFSEEQFRYVDKHLDQLESLGIPLITFYKKAAELGYAEAQFKLSEMIGGGEASDEDINEAVKWLQKAAELGNTEAQMKLGQIYLDRESADLDINKVLKWLQEAANQGHTGAMNYLGEIYDTGEGVAQDFGKAFEWYKKAANQGNFDSMHSVAKCYEAGDGVQKNIDKALEWYEKAYDIAYDEGNNDALEEYNDALCDDILPDYANLLVETGNYHEAVEKYHVYFNNDHCKSSSRYTWEYTFRKNEIIEKNKKLSIKATYEKKPDINTYVDNDAIFNQAMLYFEGRHYKDAFIWFKKAAIQGDAPAQAELANMYFDGFGVEPNIDNAIEWYEKAANQDYLPAQLELANIYYIGDVVDLNYDDAFKWYQAAAKSNHPEAQYFLGLMYQNGDGVNENLGEAIYWLGKAAEQGDVVAQQDLSRIYLDAEEPDLLKFYEVLSDPSLDKEKHVVGMILVSNGVMVDIDFIKTFELLIEDNDFIKDHEDKISPAKIFMKGYEQNKDEFMSFMIENHD